MRMEKGFLHWKSDLLTEFDPFETGLSRFVKMEKPEFIGKAALAQRQQAGPVRKLVTLHVDCEHAPALGGASIRANGTVVGTITSGDWGHRVGMNLAYGFVDAAQVVEGAELTVDVIGEPMPASILDQPPYDPEFSRLRA